MISESKYGIVKRARVTELTPQFNCFGDSFSDSGGGWAFPTWVQLLATELGKTLIGRGGIAGARTYEILVNQIYNDWVTRPFGSTNSALLFMGINDLNAYYFDDDTRTFDPDVVTDAIAANTTTAMLYCALPGSSKYNARQSVLTGTWINTQSFTNLGVGTITANSSISQTVTGRYVSFTITTVAPSSVTDYGPLFNWSVSNTLLANNSIGTYFGGGANGAPASFRVTAKILSGNFVTRTFIFDTSVEGDHTILITLVDPVSQTTPVQLLSFLYVDWFGGWSDDVQANDVVVLGIPSWDYARAWDFGAHLTSDDRRLNYNRRLKESCDSLYNDYALPVRYIDTGFMSNAHLQLDGFHPNAIGFRHLKKVVAKALAGATFAE